MVLPLGVTVVILPSCYASSQYIVYAWPRNSAVLRQSFLSRTGIMQRFRPWTYFPCFNAISKDYEGGVSANAISGKPFKWKMQHAKAESLMVNFEAARPNDSKKRPLLLPVNWRAGLRLWDNECCLEPAVLAKEVGKFQTFLYIGSVAVPRRRPNNQACLKNQSLDVLKIANYYLYSCFSKCFFAVSHQNSETLWAVISALHAFETPVIRLQWPS